MSSTNPRPPLAPLPPDWWTDEEIFGNDLPSVEKTRKKSKRSGPKKTGKAAPPISTTPPVGGNVDWLLAALKIQHWDYLLVGDGSGTTWANAAGWAAVLVEEETRQEREFYGGFSQATNIVSEIMAYVQPLLWIMSEFKDLATKQLHIVTDCQYVANAGNNQNMQKKTHVCLWAALNAAKMRGLVIRWHWLPRDQATHNKWSHKKANAARMALLGLRSSKEDTRADVPDADASAESE